MSKMTKEDYLEFKNSHLTQKFFQYLLDYRKVMMEKWAQGRLSQSEQMEAVARCQMADEITALDDDSIANFYAANKGE